MTRFPGFDVSVTQALDEFFARPRDGRWVAVFDADGTLWRGDVGEEFFRHQLERKLVPCAPTRDAWQTYFREANGGDTPRAFSWLAQWNVGVRETDLQQWCAEFFQEKWAPFVFEPMRVLVSEFVAAGAEIWVVTGSPRWIVQEGVKSFGIPASRVIGTSVLVRDGLLTTELEHEVPYRAGKARLLEKLVGIGGLVFAAGNTFWDKEMMQLASELVLAINSEEAGEPNHESEQRLHEHALANKWLAQRFGR